MGSTARKSLAVSPECPGTSGSAMPKARCLSHSDSSYRSPERAAMPLTSPAPPLGDADVESPKEPRLPVASSQEPEAGDAVEAAADRVVERALQQPERPESDEPAA